MITTVFIFFLLFFAIALLIMAFAKPKRKEDISVRVQKLREKMQKPEEYTERKGSKGNISSSLQGFRQKLVPLALKLISPDNEDYIKSRLIQAGKYEDSVIDFYTARIFFAILFSIGIGLIGFLAVLGYDLAVSASAFAIAGAFGYFFPLIYLNMTIEQRRIKIFRRLPDTLDLLTICLEAGMGLNAALQKVMEKMAPGPLQEELNRMLKEIQIGKSRVQALRDLSQRVNMPELTSVMIAMIQSEQMGTSLTQTLKIQSEIIRELRWQKAQELAQQAPVKLVFPIALFIFPTIFLVIFGPLVLSFIVGR